MSGNLFSGDGPAPWGAPSLIVIVDSVEGRCRRRRLRRQHMNVIWCVGMFGKGGIWLQDF